MRRRSCTPYKTLLPTLQFTRWPDPVAVPCVEQAWPAARVMVAQYKLLLKRLRYLGLQLSTTHAYDVVQLVVWNCLAAVSRLPFVGDMCVLAVVSQFLLPRGRRLKIHTSRGPECWTVGRTFVVDVHSICMLGYGRLFAASRGTKVARSFRGQVGSFAALSTLPLHGLRVRVCRPHSKPSPGKVAAHVDLDPTVHRLEGGEHCWHAARVLHRVRLLRGPESACERRGSLLHQLWNAVQGLEPQRLAARLFIREGGLTGSGAPEEEPVIEEIEQALRKSGDVAHAFTKRRRVQVEQPRRAPDTCVDEKATHLRRSLRGASFVVQKSVYQPMNIPTVCSEALAKHSRRDRSGATIIGPLPMFRVDPRQQGLAQSEMRRRLREWMASNEGKDWRESRTSLFGRIDMGDDDDDEVADDDG